MTIKQLIGGLALLCLAGGVAAARVALKPTITPASHDFGDNVVGVGGNWFEFTVTVPPGGGHTDSLRSFITGPDAADFRITPNAGVIPTPGIRPNCQNIGRGVAQADIALPAGTCKITIEFVPASTGPKSAILRIVDKLGMVSATLTGTGVYGCRYAVVPCNYAAFYNGTISWKSTLRYNASSPNGSFTSVRTVDVTASITNGKAICAGTVQEDRNDTSGDGARGWLRATVGTTGVSPGAPGATPTAAPAIPDGLFAVEFDEDPVLGDYYLVTIACPSEEGTDSTMNVTSGGKDGNDIESTPAGLDGREMTSEKQPARLGIGMDLKGQINYRHPDADPANGVTGTVVVTWDLTGQRAPPSYMNPRRPPPP